MLEEPLKDGILTLPAVLDLNSASALRASLRDVFERTETVALDCSQVSRITTPAVQILLSLTKSMDTTGHRPTFITPSEAFRSAFRDLGLQDHLSHWSTP